VLLRLVSAIAHAGVRLAGLGRRRLVASEVHFVADNFSGQARKGRLFICHIIQVAPVLGQVKVSVKTMSPALREVAEPRRWLSPPVLLGVVVGAVGLGAPQPMLAFFELEEVRMVLLLFPPMRGPAHILELATIHVSSN